MSKDKIVPAIIFISFFVGFIFGEDSLGGGRHDYLYHQKYFLKFLNEFIETFENYGLDLVNENVRNSPVFYMMFAYFLKIGLDLEHLKFANLLIIIPLIIFFNKCISIKYPNSINKNKLYLIAALFLSPTLRTLLIWPYPFIWALTFFVISIYFYLKFDRETVSSKKFLYSIYNIFSIAIASYFTPNFAIFALFFLFKFYREIKYSEIISLIFLNIVLALPAFLFLISKDFYLFNSDGVGIDSYTRFNPSNKIIIISSFLFLYILPVIPKISKPNEYLSYSNKTFYIISILIIFIISNIYFYNFIDNAGGGIFYHTSQLVFNNSLILFFVFCVSILLFYILGLYNLNNILIFVSLIIYNMQFSIYYKYFDPLLLFIVLFLLKFKQPNFINLEKVSNRYVVFYVIFLGLNLAKGFIDY